MLRCRVVVLSLIVLILNGLFLGGIVNGQTNVKTENSKSDLKSEATPDHSTRPKVGLVLSGGGARGFAHVGVLQWFEDHHIPIDYISGTSIGGLIGALYAMGLSPGEIRSFLQTIDWDNILRQSTKFENLSFRRKEDRREFKTDFEFGLKGGAKLPEGISSGHYIGMLFDRLTLPYNQLESFDDLPTPFRCMGTDLVEGKSVVLKNGSLSTAMRATMSIPGVFPPVERGGKVLVDGGLLNNIPTDVMRAWHPDIVIAVDIGTPLGTDKTIGSLFGILQQSITVMTIENDRRNLRLADIILAPELGTKSILDFTGLDETIAIGYQASNDKTKVLSAFAIDDASWNKYLAARNSRKRFAPQIPTEIEIPGVDANASTMLQERLEKFVGRPFVPQELEQELTKIIGEGRYESIGYQLSPYRADGKVVLSIRVKEKSYAPPSLNIGVEIEGNDINDVNFTLGGRLTLYDVGKYGSELRGDLKLGFRTLVALEYYSPIGETLARRRSLFWVPRAFYRREREGIFFSGNRLLEFQVDRLGLGLDLAYLKERSEVRLGYEVGRVSSNIRAGLPLFPEVDGTVSFARLKWSYDNQDSATIPTRGLRFTTEGRFYVTAPDANEKRRSFSQADIHLTSFRPLARGGSMILGFSGGTTFNKDAAPVQQFTLGGPFELTAYNQDEFRGNHFLLSTMGYMRPIGELKSLLAKQIYALGFYQLGGAFPDILSPRIKNSFSAGIVVDTRLGPFSIIAGVGESKRGKIYFSFGRFF